VAQLKRNLARGRVRSADVATRLRMTKTARMHAPPQACELDFIAEGRNAERAAAAFAAAQPRVATAPAVLWERTAPRVLTMQWVDGCRVRRMHPRSRRETYQRHVHALRLPLLASLRRWMTQRRCAPRAWRRAPWRRRSRTLWAKWLSASARKLVLCLCTRSLVSHLAARSTSPPALPPGFVHGDLHPGNIRVLPTPAAHFWSAPVPLLVLLDHGLYAELGEPLRLAYCALWCACALLRVSIWRALTQLRCAGKRWH
jgi:predicted unusual protein kinase regulating ubiquinone biosynthesis (AarF/ABC1/UbiB family)